MKEKKKRLWCEYVVWLLFFLALAFPVLITYDLQYSRVGDWGEGLGALTAIFTIDMVLLVSIIVVGIFCSMKKKREEKSKKDMRS